MSHDVSHESASPPSPWIDRWLPPAPAGARALDLACGFGRHTALLLERGWTVCAVDRDGAALRQVQAKAAGLYAAERLQTVMADVEGQAWPLPGQRFDAIVVTNYLWRPLLPTVFASLKPDGVLIYETFAVGNETFGRPRNPDFLLKPGELLDFAKVGPLHVVAYENGHLSMPDRVVQRMVAVNSDAPRSLEPAR